MTLVWYAAYGSNMHAARLGYYLKGGTPLGARRTYPGCRDGSPPRRTVAAMLPGGVYFALESRAWTGGMAFYDPTLPGTAAARGYLLTLGQFSDIAAQEMLREPTGDLDLAALLRDGRLRLGDGRYETVVHAGDLDGRPVLTFTAPWTATEAPLNAPAPRYLEMISSGLHEAHRWSAAEVAAYLVERPGIAGAWGLPELTRLAERGIDLGMLVAAPDPDAA